MEPSVSCVCLENVFRQYMVGIGSIAVNQKETVSSFV